jgi:hypothetical protein
MNMSCLVYFPIMLMSLSFCVHVSKASTFIKLISYKCGFTFNYTNCEVTHVHCGCFIISISFIYLDTRVVS